MSKDKTRPEAPPKDAPAAAAATSGFTEALPVEADPRDAEIAALKAELAKARAASAAKVSTPAAPGSLWRVALRHSPVGAAARRCRTVEAPGRESAWPK